LDVVGGTAQGHLALPCVVGRPCALIVAAGQPRATDIYVFTTTKLQGLTGASSPTIIVPSMHHVDEDNVIITRALAKQATSQPFEEVAPTDLFTVFSHDQASGYGAITRNYCR
jgi:hypothetical protein